MRFRITVRGDNTELRGYLVPTDNNMLNELAECMKPFGMVVASAADDAYDPFREADARELHHFETEQENERLKAERAKAAQYADALESNWEEGDLASAVADAVAFLRSLGD
jgi:hypothetical protein